MKILSSMQTRNVEKKAMRMGMSGERLMENAGAAATRAIKENFAIKDCNVVVISGQGNNGGDGFVVARKLKEYGASVTVILAMGSAVTADSTTMLERARQSQVTFVNYYDDQELCETIINSADMVVDAIFGIGFRGAPDRDISKIIANINSSKAIKIALDIPSGLNCDSGEVKAEAVCADFTVTFIGYKPCHFLFPSTNYCGKTVAVSIGVDDELIDECQAEIIEDSNSLKLLSSIPFAAHKGTKGVSVIVGGSYGMAGAPVIAAKAAYRSGAGIVKIALPEKIYPIGAAMLPEAVFAPLADDKGFLTSSSISDDLFDGAKSILIGPGMGLNGGTIGAVAKGLAKAKVPTVVDADALNAIAEDPDILNLAKTTLILTPHPGEMAKLCSKTIAQVQNNRIEIASEFAAKYGVITVLKGAYTVIALPDGRVYINKTGNQGMATAGSGDMLAGMIAAFLANGTNPISATVAAVNLHGAVGDLTANEVGQRGMIVSDMIERLPFVLNKNNN